MRSFLFLALAVLVTACARQPRESLTPTAEPAAADPSAQTQPAQPAPPITAEEKKLSLDPVTLQKQGYRIVDEEGRRLYCRTETSTGSHVRKKTYCLTADELAALRDSAREAVESMRKVVPPPKGN